MAIKSLPIALDNAVTITGSTMYGRVMQSMRKRNDVILMFLDVVSIILFLIELAIGRFNRFFYNFVKEMIHIFMAAYSVPLKKFMVTTTANAVIGLHKLSNVGPA